MRASAEGTAYSSGVYGRVLEAEDVSDTSNLTTIANNELKKYAFEPQQVSFRSFTSTWTAGTKIQVNLPAFGITANTSFLIDEVNAWRYDTNIMAYDIHCTKRNDSDFSTQREAGGYEYINDMVQASRGNGGVTGAVYSGSIRHYQATNTATVTITSSETTVATKSFYVPFASDIHMTFSAHLIATAGITITAKTYLQEGAATAARTYQPQHNLSGNATFTYCEQMQSISAGSSVITVKLSGDTGTTTISANFSALNITVFPLTVTATATANYTPMGYIMGGGISGPGYIQDCDQYISDTWTNKTDMPDPTRYANAASTISGKAYSYCGYNGTKHNDCDEYDSSGNSWASKTDVPAPDRYSLAASTILNKGYVYGGFSAAVIADCDEYVVDTWTNKTDMTAGRYKPRATTISGKGYVVGGNDSGFTKTGSNYEYTPDTWATKTSMTAMIFGNGEMACCTISNKGYWFGNTDYGNKNEEYVVDTWASKTGLPAPLRNSHTASDINNKAYSYCGNDDVAAYMQDCDEYVVDTWTNKTDAPAPARSNLAAASI